MNNRLIILFIVLAVQFYGCKKVPKPTEVPISPELIKHFNFKEGSYWVYKDLLTGKIDSSYIINYTSSYYIDYNQSFKSYYVGYYIYNDDVYTTPAIKKIYWDITLQDSALYLQDGNTPPYYWGIVYVYPLRTYKFHYADSGEIRQIYPSYTLNNMVFKNVTEVYHKQNNIYEDTFYVAEDVGVINAKLNHLDDSSRVIWELQKYNIVK